MSDPAILASYEGPLRSRVGGAFPGKRAVFRGYDLHRDLRDIGWLDLYMFGISGRRLSPSQLRLLDAIWAYTSYPDARLWNNRVASLAGTARSSGTLGISASLAVSEAGVYGGQIFAAVAGFYEQTKKQVDAGGDLYMAVTDYLRRNRGIPGYGRPLGRSAEDERNAPILELASSLGLADGPYVRLANEVENILLNGRWRMRMNNAALTAALVLDMGLTPQNHYLYLFPAFLAGMLPCYLEALEKPEAASFALRCERIEYEGPARRSWGD